MIGIIAILAAIVIVAINPAKRFQDARNSQRQANIESIMSAIQQNMVDNKGITTCTINSSLGYIKRPATAPDTDLTSCLKTYLAVLPLDPQDGIGDPTDGGGNYDTHYQVKMDPTTHQVTVVAPSADGDGGPTGGYSVTR